MRAFAAAIASAPDGRWHVPDGWQQGRGAWGGLVVGALVEAVARLEDPDRPVRSVSAQLSAPALAEPHELSVERLRAGSALSTWSVALDSAAGERVAQAVILTGQERASDMVPAWEAWQSARMPVADWRTADVVPLAPPIAPAFSAHLAFRPLTGLPMSGQEMVSGWIGFPDAGEWSAAALLALVDGWWPVAISRPAAMRPMATVSFAANLLVDPATVPAGEPLYFEGTVAGALGGYVSELRRMWTADGRLAVENLQSIAVIK